MAEPGTFEKILGEVGQALLPLRDALRSPQELYAFLLKLGWHADDIPQPLRDLGTGLDTLLDELRRLLGDGGLNVGGSPGGDVTADISAAGVARAVQAVQQVVGAIRAIATAPDSAFPPRLREDNFKSEFPRQVVDYLIVTYLRRHHPSVGFALQSLGVVKTTYVAPTGNRLPYVRYRLDLADLPTALGDPSVVLRNAFGWGTPDFDFRAFGSQLDNLLATIGVDLLVESMPTGTAVAIEGVPDPPGAPRRTVLKAVVFERVRPSGRMAAEVQLMPLPARGAGQPGFALLPAFNGVLDFDFPLGPDINVRIRSDLNLRGGVAVLIRPGEPVGIVVGFREGGPSSASGSIETQVTRSGTDGAPILVFGTPDSTRLQYRKVGGLGGLRIGSDGTVDVFAEVELKGLEFVFDPADADGFIAKIIPADGIGFGVDLTLGVSHRDGFYFRGAAQLEIAVPAHVRLGPVEVLSLTISARPAGTGLPVNLGATFRAELGPVKAVVENIGLTAAFSFRPDLDGNLGPLDLALRFKPPNGIGLSVDAGIVTGGGYLFIDPDRGEYAGALELTFANFLAIKAVGIITTRMPDGSRGFSLLVIMSVEFGNGLQLGFGFTLLAVGGLLGLNRTMNLEALVAGVRTGAITSVLFPRDIVANAPKIISDLRGLFPPREGTFLIGPMAKLGWGTPTLVSLSVGIIIEIPGNVAILGLLRVAVPAADVAIIQLQVAFVGAIEFDRKRLYFFASLFDSRIAFLTIDGELGVLTAWGDDANFVISVGGFHPRFNPPPLPFPTPRRISVSMLNNPLSRVRFEGYFAVTSNTVQFGARVEVFFGLDAVNVQGHLALDALFQFSPFHFIIEISASLAVKVFGVGLFSVSVRGALEGPTPWHIKGHGSISLLFFDIDVDFETTWGERRDTQLPPIAVLPLIQTELGKPENWRAVPPDTNRLLVTPRGMPAEEAALILHPTGVLRVTQRAVPLGIRLDKIGNQKPSDVNRLDVTVTGGGLTRRADTFERFAPAQFQDFSDADKLSRPAFAPERAGLDLSAGGSDLRSSLVVKRLVRYEEIIIDSNFKRFQQRFTGLFGSMFRFFLAGSAISRITLSRAAAVKLTPFSDRITVSDESFTVAFQATNKAYTAEARSFHTEASARDYLRRKVAAEPALVDAIHVIPSFERAP